MLSDSIIFCEKIAMKDFLSMLLQKKKILSFYWFLIKIIKYKYMYLIYM